MNAKELRKQIKNVLESEEYVQSIITNIAINEIRKVVMERLEALEQRHKDFQSLALRELSKQQTFAPAPKQPSTPSDGV